MASTDARPIPRKNTAFRLTVPILDADGDLVSGATGLDSEVSIDGGAFADCTNEATEIGASGIYYLDLTAAEMNGDTIAVIVKSTEGKTTPVVLYPEELGDVRVNVGQWNGTAVPSEHTAGYPIVTVKDGTGTGEIDTTSGGVLVAALATQAKADVNAEVDTALADYDAPTHTELVSEVNAVQSDIAALNDLDAAGVRAAVGLASANLDAQLDALPTAAENADAVLDEALAGHITAGTLGKAIADIEVDTSTTLQGELDGIQADTEDIQSRLPAALVAGRIDASVGAMAANTLTASAVAADAVTEIQAGLSVLDAAGVRTAVGLAAANLDTQLTAIDDAIDTEVAAIKAKTDNLPTDPADQSAVEAAITAATSPLATSAALATVSGLVDDLEGRLTAIRAGYLDNLSGGAVALASALATVAGYLDTEVAAILAAVDTEVAAIKAKTDNLPASPAAVGSAMTLDLTQAVPTSNTGQTVGDALNAARAQGFGKWVLSGTSLVLYAADGVTVVRTFTLDSATAPTSRT